MPCCWPPTRDRRHVVEPAGLRRSPPAAPSHHAAGSTSVPSGCVARALRGPARRSRRRGPPPCRTGSTSRPRRRGVYPRAPEQVLDGELVRGARSRSRARRPCRRRSPRTRCGRRAGRRSVSPAASVGLRELGDPAGGQRLLHLGVGPERRRPLLEQQVRAHVGGGRRPDAVDVLGAQRLVVEVPRAVVGGRRRAAVLQQVDQDERVEQVAVAEDQVLVVLGAALAVEVDVEELAVPQRLRDAVREVEPGHLLVADLGVEADHVGVLERADERERVADGRQQDVAARLVGLGLDGEPDAVALVDRRTAASSVEALAVAVERGPDVLGRRRLSAPSRPPQNT